MSEARALLGALSLVGEDVIDLALRDEPATQYGRHEGYLHLTSSSASWACSSGAFGGGACSSAAAVHSSPAPCGAAFRAFR